MGLDFMTQDLLKDTVYTYNGHKVIIGKVGESNSWCTSENIIHAGSYYKNSVLRLQWSLEEGLCEPLITRFLSENGI